MQIIVVTCRTTSATTLPGIPALSGSIFKHLDMGGFGTPDAGGPSGGKAMDHYIHHVSGRLRVKSSVIKKNAQRAETDLQALCGAVPGIRATELNKSAGCVIIYYDPEDVTLDHILGALREAGYLAKLESTQMPAYQPYVAAKAGDLFGKALFNVFVNRALERSVVSLVTAPLPVGTQR
jgi:copper chaperone CopZ